mmetsp:Transcript_24585/g.38531  ORF Transcript_24585/g.38531 Transcript_24585/m.38531 type:complete len:399 (-) Transcript_24585:34-1230(-)
MLPASLVSYRASSDFSIPLWLWGVAVCTFATALTALGLVLQKYSHTLTALREEKVVYYKQPWWIAGFATFMIAQVINLISMSMAPQLIISCLGATALVFNALFAALILGEQLSLYEVAVMVGLLGSVVMVISSSPVGQEHAISNINEIVGPLATVHFMGFAAFVLVVLFIGQVLLFCCSMGKHEAIYWTFFSAVFSGYTVTLFKAVSEMLVAWATVRPWADWYFYAIICCACIVAITQIHTLNLALNKGRAMTVVPAYFCLSMLAQLGVSEMVVWDVPSETLPLVIFCLGIFLILVFIILLARAKTASEELKVGEDELAFVSESVLGDAENKLTDKSVSVTTPLLPRSVSTDIFGRDSNSPLKRSIRSCASLDPEAFPESFEGERTYTVSMTGSLALG